MLLASDSRLLMLEGKRRPFRPKKGDDKTLKRSPFGMKEGGQSILLRKEKWVGGKADPICLRRSRERKNREWTTWSTSRGKREGKKEKRGRERALRIVIREELQKKLPPCTGRSSAEGQRRGPCFRRGARKGRS